MCVVQPSPRGPRQPATNMLLFLLLPGLWAFSLYTLFSACVWFNPPRGDRGNLPRTCFLECNNQVSRSSRTDAESQRLTSASPRGLLLDKRFYPEVLTIRRRQEARRLTLTALLSYFPLLPQPESQTSNIWRRLSLHSFFFSTLSLIPLPSRAPSLAVTSPAPSEHC